MNYDLCDLPDLYEFINLIRVGKPTPTDINVSPISWTSSEDE
jgi:hypothetical protein